MSPSIQLQIYEEVTHRKLSEIEENEGLSCQNGRCFALMGPLLVERRSGFFGPCLGCRKGTSVLDDLFCMDCIEEFHKREIKD